MLAEEQRLPDPLVWAPRALQPLIESPREALSVFDFEPVMQKNVLRIPLKSAGHSD
ncbi:MAG: hypothetical protein HYX38_20215 [Rhodospirillales bacterium]|nr:hypothetical protein [Rhodospirillales bacterium]